MPTNEFFLKKPQLKRNAEDSPVFSQSSSIDWDQAKAKLAKRAKLNKNDEKCPLENRKQQVQIVSFFSVKESSDVSVSDRFLF